MRKPKPFWIPAALICLFSVGCGPIVERGAVDVDTLPDDALGSASELTGKVSIDGSSTVFPISEAVADGFHQTNANVSTPVGQSGTGGGFKRFTVGETDISDASRPIKQSEFDQCKANGVSFIELPIAYDGLTFVIHPDNDFVKQLTVDQLKQIFREKGAAMTWQEVNASWPERPIKLFIPGADSGTFDYFKEVIIGKDKDAAVRGDDAVLTSEDDNVLVTGVAGDPAALGFFGVAYYEENKDKLKAVPIVNPKSSAAVSPEQANIESGSYAPFSRPLFIYVNQKSLARPEVAAFVDFYLENAAAMAQKVGYVALPASIYQITSEHVAEGLTGTHFLTATGDKRSGSLTEIYLKANLVDTK